jgi:hypothetical protein
MNINKKTKGLINEVEDLNATLRKTMNKNACALIEENLNRHNEDSIMISMEKPILLCYRRNRARCNGSFDFQNASYLDYNREHQGIWVLDENSDGIDLLENMPLENAMEIFNMLVSIIKKY